MHLLRLISAALGLLWMVSSALADNRIAVVVGNANYANTPALTNPVNDATDVAGALAALGFKVTVKLDASKRELDRAMEQLSRDARTADAAIFYYAGHGMQFQGRNYLMPVDAQLQDEVSLRYEMIAVDEVKEALGGSNGVKILVLDSCRDNPLADRLKRSIRVSTRDVPSLQGFAREEAPGGMVIVYSTQANQVARDGRGRNSPFSEAFLKELATPGLEIGALFRRVGSDVFRATEGAQAPELSISLVPEYYLNQSDTDQTVWSRIRGRDDVAALRHFLDLYPDSFFAADARARMELLESRKRLQAALEPPARPAPPPLPTPVAPAASPSPAPVVAMTPPSPAQPEATRRPEVTPSPSVAALAPTPEATKEAPKPDLSAPIRDQLRRLGCFQGADVDWKAPPLQAALTKYTQLAALGRPVLEPDPALLDDMKARRSGFCLPSCAAREVLLGGRCVAKTCAAGEILAGDGRCLRRPAPKPQAQEVRRPPPAPAPRARVERPASEPKRAGGRCFAFNGAQYCD